MSYSFQCDFKKSKYLFWLLVFQSHIAQGGISVVQTIMADNEKEAQHPGVLGVLQLLMGGEQHPKTPDFDLCAFAT